MRPDAALHQQLADMRPILMKFAAMRLRNPALAEDAVHDALLAVLEHPGGYAGRSSLRTYVTGILYFKIVDTMRLRARECEIDGAAGDNDPADHADPQRLLENKQLLALLGVAMERLPGKMGRAFMLREGFGLDTTELCDELAVTEPHAWVLLHRARQRLQTYLRPHKLRP